MNILPALKRFFGLDSHYFEVFLNSGYGRSQYSIRHRWGYIYRNPYDFPPNCDPGPGISYDKDRCASSPLEYIIAFAHEWASEYYGPDHEVITNVKAEIHEHKFYPKRFPGIIEVWGECACGAVNVKFVEDTIFRPAHRKFSAKVL